MTRAETQHGADHAAWAKMSPPQRRAYSGSATRPCVCGSLCVWKTCKACDGAGMTASFERCGACESCGGVWACEAQQMAK